MIPDNSIIYLETSAINYLAKKYSWKDGKATKIYHKLKGTKFYISNVTIWEVLLTSDEELREKLIFYLQNIGHEKLINSPSEFIINYILNGCPISENRYDFHSKLDISKTWLDLCENTAKTFVFDTDELQKKSNEIRKFIKIASEQLEEIGLLLPNSPPTEIQLFLDNILRTIKGINPEKKSARENKLLRISILLVVLIVCSEVDFDNTPIKNYWKKLNINKIENRILYLLTKHEELFYQGPFIVLSEMILIQLEKGGKPTRGIFWDALHSIYLIYTDMFFTTDEHFKKLKENNENSLYKKIILLDCENLFTAKEI
jgi:hypothetical protein